MQPAILGNGINSSLLIVKIAFHHLQQYFMYVYLSKHKMYMFHIHTLDNVETGVKIWIIHYIDLVSTQAILREGQGGTGPPAQK